MNCDYNLSRDQVGTSNTDNRYFPMVPLGEVAELIRGITFRKSDQLEQATEDSLPIATTKAAQESGIIEDALYHIPRSLLKDERKLLRPGDILISTANSLRLVGRTTHVQDINRPISFGAFMTVIRSNAKILDTYLIHCLRTEFAYDFFSRNATTTTNISNLNFRKLATLRIPLPPLCEQKRIAALLKEQMAYVEKARQAAEEILEAAQALPGAFLRQAFPAHGDALPAGWRWAKLGDVCNKIKTTDPKRNPDNQFIYVDISSIDRSVKRITTPSVRMGKDAPSRARRIIHKGDVLVATTRPNLNAVALVGDDLDGQICSTGLCVLRPDGRWLDSNYLYRYTTHEPFVTALTEMVNGSMYPAVTDKHVMGQQIPLPPLTEQKRIAALLNEQMAYVETVRMSAREQLDAINALPAALLRRAFAGGL